MGIRRSLSCRAHIVRLRVPLQQRPIYVHKLIHLCQNWVHGFSPKKKSTSHFKNSRHVNDYIEQVPSTAHTSSRLHHKQFSRLGELTSGICVPLIKIYFKIFRIVKYYLKLMIYNHSSVPHFTTQAVGSIINRSSI
jgi:hypothetical protein